MVGYSRMRRILYGGVLFVASPPLAPLGRTPVVHQRLVLESGSPRFSVPWKGV